MSDEQLAQNTVRQMASSGADALVHEPAIPAMDLFSPLNDGRIVFSNLKDEEVTALRFAERLQQAYEYLKLDALADDVENKVTMIVATSKARGGGYLKTLVAKRMELAVSPSEVEQQRRGRR